MDKTRWCQRELRDPLDQCHEPVAGHLLCQFYHNAVGPRVHQHFPTTEPLIGDDVVANPAVLSGRQAPVVNVSMVQHVLSVKDAMWSVEDLRSEKLLEISPAGLL